METGTATRPTGPAPAAPSTLDSGWQRSWRDAKVFETREPSPSVTAAYVSVGALVAQGEVGLQELRRYTLGDVHARFRRSLGDSVLFTIGVDASDPDETRAQLERFGLSFDWARSFTTSDEDYHRWTQWLFTTLFEATLIYRRKGRVHWCKACATTLPAFRVQDGHCPDCRGPVRLTRKGAWHLALNEYNRENADRLGELHGWSDSTVALQREHIAPTDGVEIEARTMEEEVLTVFTPFPDNVSEAEFVALSPSHPKVEEWVRWKTQGVLGDVSSADWLRTASSVADFPFVDTEVPVRVPGVERPLPVLLSPAVDERYGVAAVLGIPAVDPIDAAIAGRLEASHGFTWQQDSRPSEPQPARRCRIEDWPITRQQAWATPVPMLHCDDCGDLPIPLAQLPVSPREDLKATPPALSCPKCGAQARGSGETLEPMFARLCLHLMAAVPAADRSGSVIDHPELARWLPVAQLVHDADEQTELLGQRMVAKALRDQGTPELLPDGEPYTSALVAGSVEQPEDAAPSQLAERFGADAVRFTLMYAAAPEKRINWDNGDIRYCDSFLRRLWEFAEPRLQARAGKDGIPGIDNGDPLRRRLAAWCDIAVSKITENLASLETHRATRNVIRLLASIESFEVRVTKVRGEMAELDREAVAAALVLLAQLVGPIAPHLAEELWRAGGGRGLLAQAPWPQSSAA